MPPLSAAGAAPAQTGGQAEPLCGGPPGERKAGSSLQDRGLPRLFYAAEPGLSALAGRRKPGKNRAVS